MSLNMKETINAIQTRINNALTRSGRSPGSVALMAVSKFHTVNEIQSAIDAGLTLFGENRVQEACDKFSVLELDNPGISLHMIGSLQRNKVKAILPLVSCIQSVDRIELLDEIQKQAVKTNKIIDILFEVNTGEESKSGFTDENLVFKALETVSNYTSSNIRPHGFMTMAPFTKDEKLIRSSFRKLTQIQKKAQDMFPHFNLTELSMGMSNDFEIAIEEGSTIVRVGTALFGARQ